MNWLLSEAAQSIGGRMVGTDVALTGVSTDTRGVGAGQLFIALRGERFDAHDFLEQALVSGASALLVADASKLPEGVSAIVVEDTLLALGRLAAVWRARFTLPL
ncbi:MAG: Mur ligase domain-containing protein, partial [Azonexus sp.]|nr:Mur ligase domain-containing protein [Azonexus sp.]